MRSPPGEQGWEGRGEGHRQVPERENTVSCALFLENSRIGEAFDAKRIIQGKATPGQTRGKDR